MPEAPLIDIRPDHWEIVRGILRQHVPQYAVWAFGSRAKWTAKPYSDLDVAIRTDKPLTLAVSAALADAFSESDLPWKVDVVDWATTSASFRKIIERDKVVIQKSRQSVVIDNLIKGEIPDREWQQINLGRVCLKIGSGATPRGGKDAYRGGQTTLIRSQNIYNDRFTREGLVYIDDSQANELRNVVVEENDVLLNITGDSVARCCQVDSAILPGRVNQHVAIIRPQSDMLDARFLRYVLISPKMQGHLLSLASAGATRNALTKSMIESLVIDAPTIDQQRAIAHILGSLDDKIELNRRTNETLEAMARALFQSWFVDFEPVRAKMEGRWLQGESLPGMPTHLYEFFPDQLVETEFGELPLGWCYVPFGTLLDSTIGGDWGKDTPDEDHCKAVSIIRGTDFPAVASGGIGNVPTRYTTAKKLASRQLQAGDIVVEISGGSPTQPTGRSIFVSEATLKRFSSALVCASFCRRFRPKSAELGLLAFMHLQNLYASGGTWEYQNQSTGIANFQTTHFLESEMVAMPTEKLLSAFTAQAQSLLENTSRNESLALARLRDTLLPKLISGELRVADAERLIGEEEKA